MFFAKTALCVVIFISVYTLIVSGRVHRTVAAILGGMLMILLKIVPQYKAFSYVDWNVIFLLVGMMIIMTVIGKTGFLQYVAVKSAKAARGNPYTIMAYLIFITAVFSAFLDNVTTVVFIAPVSLLIAKNLGVSPVPFLISEALASNIGGTATLIGDPPNIMIGSAAHISFLTFSYNVLSPVIVAILCLPALMRLLMKKKMEVSYERKARIMEFDSAKLIHDKVLLKKTLFVFALVVAGFFIHEYIDIEVATIAMTGAFALIMILPSQNDSVRDILSNIEWPSLFFFIGFFIMVGGLEETGVVKYIALKMTALFGRNQLAGSISILWFSGFTSAVFDNIPFTATMIPIVKQIGSSMGMPGINPLWWALSLGACLGGNMTLIGAAANVVTADISDKNGYTISFREFLKYGFFITVFNLTLASLYLWLRYFV